MVRLGNEAFVADPHRFAGKKRIGLIVNQTSFTPQMVSLLRFCARSPDVRLTAIFSPEHGLAGAAQDMEAIRGQPRYGDIPVFSLYGNDQASLTPSQEALDLVDALVFDIQDVGSRYYTFVWTMAICLRACAEAGKEMIVLDRPNPLGGNVVSGPIQEPGFLSFVGLYPVPVRHGMTAGEMARMAAGMEGVEGALTVVPMEGWRRDMWFDQTGLPWIPPSPNMPSLRTAITYPGGCLIEGTTLSEGRGTTTPFEIVGSPGIDGEALAENLGRLSLPGCAFRAVEFTPKFHKHAGRTCGGVFVHVTDRDSFDAFRVSCHIIEAVRAGFPEIFGWREEAYEFVSNVPAIDLLFGSGRLREGLSAGLSITAILAAGQDKTGEFIKKIDKFLIY